MNDRPHWITEHVPEDLRSDLFEFKVTLRNSKSMSVNMLVNIEVDYENLEHELMETPQQYVWWASVYSETKAAVTLYERAVKIRRGKLAEETLRVAQGDRVKITDKALAMIVENDEILNKLEGELIRLQKNNGKLWHMLQAIQMKSEHLRSLAGFKRQEHQQTR